MFRLTVHISIVLIQLKLLVGISFAPLTIILVVICGMIILYGVQYAMDSMEQVMIVVL